MSRPLIPFLSLYFAIFLGDLYAQSPSWQYMKKMGSDQAFSEPGGSAEGFILVHKMTDSKLNLYLTYWMSGDTVYYDGKTYKKPVTGGVSFLVLFKIRCDGSLAWTKTISDDTYTSQDSRFDKTQSTLIFGKNENEIIVSYLDFFNDKYYIDNDTVFNSQSPFKQWKTQCAIYDSLGNLKKAFRKSSDSGLCMVDGYLPSTGNYFRMTGFDTTLGYSGNSKSIYKGNVLHGNYLFLMDSNFNYVKINKISGGFPDINVDTTSLIPYRIRNGYDFNFIGRVNNKIYYLVNDILWNPVSGPNIYERNRRFIAHGDTLTCPLFFNHIQYNVLLVYNDTGGHVLTKFGYSRTHVPKSGNYGAGYIYPSNVYLGSDNKFYFSRANTMETNFNWGDDTIYWPLDTIVRDTAVLNYGAIDTNGKLLWNRNIYYSGPNLQFATCLLPSNEQICHMSLSSFYYPPAGGWTNSDHKLYLNGTEYSNQVYQQEPSTINHRPIMIKMKKDTVELLYAGSHRRRYIGTLDCFSNKLGDIFIFGNKRNNGSVLEDDSSNFELAHGQWGEPFIAKYGSGVCQCDTATASFNSDTSQIGKITVQYTGSPKDSVLFLWGDGSQNFIKPATAPYTKIYNKDTTLTIQCIVYNNCFQGTIAKKTHKILCDTVESAFVIIDSNIRGRTAVKFTGSRVDSVIYLWGNGTQSIAKPDTMILSKVYNKDTIVTIACIAFNQCGKPDTSFQTVHILCDTPINDFNIISNLNGTVSVVYKGGSMDTVDFLWGDGQQSKVFNPSSQTTNHTYTNLNSDSAKISCVIKNMCGIADTLTKTVPIVCDTPTNLFRIKSSNNRTIALEYYGNSTDTITFLLGDGNQIKVSNPTTQVVSHTYTNLSLDSVTITCEVKNKCGKKTTTTLGQRFCQSQKNFQSILICDTNHILTKLTDTNLIFQNWSDGSTTATKTISMSQKMTGIYLQKNGCNYKDSFDIVKYTSPSLQKSKKYLDCKKTPITLSVSNADATGYLWSTAAISASIQANTKGEYSVRITHPCGIFRDTIKVLDTATSVYDTLKKTVCEKYFWRDTTYTKTGKYTRTISKPNSCDSVLTLDLKVGLEPKVTLSNGINYRVEEDFKSYQWYLCSPWKKINNETKKTFTTITRGSYAVIVSNGECVDTSDCIALYS
ncbi:MAG: hypothetical protein ACK5QP_04800, partial [Chitinophagales bacterium]